LGVQLVAWNPATTASFGRTAVPVQQSSPTEQSAVSSHAIDGASHAAREVSQ